MGKKVFVKQSFIDLLQLILEKTKEGDEIKLRQMFEILSGKGYAALLIVLSFPFCIPIQIPGFSTPFGIILGFLGLRIAFAKHPWWPKWILDKKFSSQHVEMLIQKAIKVVRILQKVLHPRLVILTKNPIAHRMHGLLVFVLSVLLSLPLPIPFSNMLAAFPILFIGLGLLEDDGVSIIIGYFLACVCFSAFLALFLFGKAQITNGFFSF